MNNEAITLQPGETILHRTTLHPIIYLPPAIWTIAWALAAAIMPMPFAVVPLALSSWGIVGLARRHLDRLTTEMFITNRRVITKIGIFRRDTAEMNASKIESVRVAQSILGRMLNYGTVVVRGTGASLEPFPFVRNPLEFRNRLKPE